MGWSGTEVLAAQAVCCVGAGGLYCVARGPQHYALLLMPMLGA